jgi:hypothetical protein
MTSSLALALAGTHTALPSSSNGTPAAEALFLGAMGHLLHRVADF